MAALKLPPPPTSGGSGATGTIFGVSAPYAEGVVSPDAGMGGGSSASAITPELAQWFQQVQTVVNNLAARTAYYKYVPSGSGFSVQVPAATGLLLIANASVLASGTVVLPAKAYDGMPVDISAVSTVTSASVTVQSGLGMVIVGTAVTSFPANVTFRYVYNATANSWTRVQ